MTRKMMALFVGAMAAIAMPVTASAQADSASTTQDSAVATFEGQTLRLAESWGDAQACFVATDAIRCYRTYDELIEREVIAHDVAAPLAACSTPTTLWSGTGHTGSSVAFSTRGVYSNLASLGFDNVTSSYTVGACAARFYDVYPNTSLYPGSTSAGASASSMSSGWDNRISSVYIT